ncbi:Hypothetical protein UVM_LOCUS308 [uncultured virus]|nr:Hypothetical protein UVM_LOCUS308 [uncultured virus]
MLQPPPAVPTGSHDVDTVARELMNEFVEMAGRPNITNATLTFHPLLKGPPDNPGYYRDNYSVHPRVFEMHYKLSTVSPVDLRNKRWLLSPDDRSSAFDPAPLGLRPTRAQYMTTGKFFVEMQTYDWHINMHTDQYRVDLDEAEDMLADALFDLPASLQQHWFGVGMPVFEATVVGLFDTNGVTTRDERVHRIGELAPLRDYLANLDYGASTIAGAAGNRAELQRSANEWLDWIVARYGHPVDRDLPLMEMTLHKFPLQQLQQLHTLLPPTDFTMHSPNVWTADALALKLSEDSRQNFPLLKPNRDPSQPPFTPKECEARFDFLEFQLRGIQAYLTLFGYPRGDVWMDEYRRWLQELVDDLPPAAARAAQRTKFVDAARSGMSNVSDLQEALQVSLKDTVAKCRSQENVDLHAGLAREREGGNPPAAKRAKS